MIEEFVQFRQVLDLHRFKLHRHLGNGTVKSVWLRQVFGLLRVWFRQVLLYHENLVDYEVNTGSIIMSIKTCIIFPPSIQKKKKN